jgi:hypothetical protein
VFSMENQVSPLVPQTYTISGLPFSMENQVSPLVPQTYTISGLPFSMENQVSPVVPQTYTISGLPFSILNGVSPAISSPQTYAISGLTFSILNGMASAVRPQIPTVTGATSTSNGPPFTGTTSTSTAPPFQIPTAPSLGFRIPINPAFVAEALARGAERINGKPVCMDSDGDGLCDSDELIIGTNPFMADTDGDGYPDGLELLLGSDPLDFRSIPDIRPPGYYVTPPVSIKNTNPFAKLTPRRQGAVNASNKR